MAGFKDFVDLTVLAESDLDDFLAKQVVMKFASAAARNAALAAVLREGMVAYLDDLNVVTVYSGAAWSTIGPVHGAWTSYTPVVTQSGVPTITNNYSRYMRVGRFVKGIVYVTISGAGGVGGNGVSVSLPVTSAQGSSIIVGSGRIYDQSATTYYPGMVALALTTAFVLVPAATNDAGTSLGALNFTAALAASDEILASFEYEASADA